MGTSCWLLAGLLLFRLASFTAVEAQYPPRFRPVCGRVADPPPAGWKKWSSPSTWLNGVVPGVGKGFGLDAVIPCNTGVLLDVSIVVRQITIKGWLKVESLGPLFVKTAHVLNQGRLTIGTRSVPYTGRITFNLTGNYQLPLTSPPASPSSPHMLGLRAFATAGGQLELNGMYGNAPGWTTLAVTAPAGARQIVVRGDVTAWPVGGEIALASTDFDRTQAERRRIAGVTKGSSGTTVIRLSSPLDWMHWGGGVSTGIHGVQMDQAGEVALLTRSILIQGHPNADNPVIGGHFIVFQTATPQFIKGVELNNMGQQGLLGRYPMHFHLAQDHSRSVVDSCSVHNSNQRCFVVHGTFNLLVRGNVGFDTKGHCFMVEDGIEYGNVFHTNLGFLQEPPVTLPPQVDGGSSQSDGTPSTFWISNPNNTYINNVAAGSSDSGWWFELKGQITGPSATYPGASSVQPFILPMGRHLFQGNAAHSNGRAGLRTYPSGYRPRLNGGISRDQNHAGINAPQVRFTFTGFRAYKNQFIGMFIHETDGLVIDGAMVADNAAVGIELNKDENVIIKNSIFLGESVNIGNPTMCDVPSNTFAGCKPLYGSGLCDLPIPPSKARSNSRTVTRYSPKYGILIDQNDRNRNEWTLGNAHRIFNNSFAFFHNRCHPAAGITANGHSNYIWPAGHTSWQLSFPDGSPRIFMPNRSMGQLGFDGGYGDPGPLSEVYVWRDRDGSLVGGRGGYAVANNPSLLPTQTQCTFNKAWNAYGCPGACYRTVSIAGSPYTLINSRGRVVRTEGVQLPNLPTGAPLTLLLANAKANTRGGRGGGQSSSRTSSRGGISANSAAVTSTAAATARASNDSKSDSSDGDFAMAMATVLAAEAVPLYQPEAAAETAPAHARSTATTTTAGSSRALHTHSTPDTAPASVFAPTVKSTGRAVQRGKAVGHIQAVSGSGASFEVSYADDWFGCQQAVTLQVRPPSASTHWVPAASGSVRWSACPGVSKSSEPATNETLLQLLCSSSSSSQPLLQLQLPAGPQAHVLLQEAPGDASCTKAACGVFTARSSWYSFRGSGRPSDFLRAEIALPAAWAKRQAPFGFGRTSTFASVLTPAKEGAHTWYFRRTFFLPRRHCYSSLHLSHNANDGLVAWINGKLALRVNMPSGTPVHNDTALSHVSPTAPWSTSTLHFASLHLQPGANTVSVELHAASPYVDHAFFDLALSAVGSLKCATTTS